MAPLGDTGPRVAVVGFGRSEAHATGFLLSHTEPSLHVDVLETPAAELTREELLRRYDAIIYAVGDLGVRALSVPGAELAGVTSATAFWHWLGGHPEPGDIDLGCRRAVVIGDSDAGLDVARALTLAPGALTEVVVLCRRGPEQAGFSPSALGDLGRVDGADVVADPTEVAVPASFRELAPDATAERNLALLREYATRPRRGHPRRLAMRFLLSPTMVLGHGRVQALELVRNTLVRDGDGRLHPRATQARATISAGLVISAVAESWTPLPGVPVDAHGDPNVDDQGRVRGADGRYTREYVSRPVTHGPAAETVRALLHDLASGRLDAPVRAVA